MAKTDLIGNAGAYWVVSQLSLRGLVALPTVRNCPGADVMVLEPDTGALATVQVKTSGKRPSFWPASEPAPAWHRSNHVYVFLRRDLAGRAFEAFLLPAPEVIANIRANARDLAERGKKPFGEFRLPRDPASQETLRAAWESWRPASEPEQA